MTCLGMFQRGGIKILTAEAANIIRLCDGTRTTQEIASASGMRDEKIVREVLDALS